MNDTTNRDNAIAVFIGLVAYTVTLIAPNLSWLMIAVVMCDAGWVVWRWSQRGSN